MSGFLARMPRPLQGASTKMASAMGRSASGLVPSETRGSTFRNPIRSTALRMSWTRFSLTSQLTSRPWSPISSMRSRLLPPGAAQRSRTVSPGFASTQRAASWLACPSTWKKPSRKSPLSAGLPSKRAKTLPGTRPGAAVFAPEASSFSQRASGVPFRGLARRLVRPPSAVWVRMSSASSG